jgi:hypothetical protein
MNIKLKTTFFLIFTLIIGMAIGAMMTRAFLQNRVQRVFQRRAPNVFVQSYLEAIKPDQEKQKQITKILDAYAQRMSEIREKSRQDLETLMDSMLAELGTVLTPEQVERLTARPPAGRPSYGRHTVQEEQQYLSEELDLTEEQSALIKKVLEEYRRPPEMKRPDMMKRGNPEEMAALFRKQREKMLQEIQKILTEEQMKKYEDIQRSRSRRFRDSR